MKHQPLTIDTSEFTRLGDAAQGDRPVATLPRLVSLLLDDSGTVAWELAGRVDQPAEGGRHPVLALSMSGAVTMRCVRCLDPVEIEFDVQRDFRLAASEAQAAREDVEDEHYDVLVGSRQFDVAALIEDEAIMALPLAPRHDDCRPPAGTEGAEEPVPDERPNPFAMLQRLRRDRADDPE